MSWPVYQQATAANAVQNYSTQSTAIPGSSTTLAAGGVNMDAYQHMTPEQQFAIQQQNWQQWQIYQQQYAQWQAQYGEQVNDDHGGLVNGGAYNNGLLQSIAVSARNAKQNDESKCVDDKCDARPTAATARFKCTATTTRAECQLNWKLPTNTFQVKRNGFKSFEM